MSWSNKVFHNNSVPQDQLLSSLFNENTFYAQFISDLQNASQEVIIESPYITLKRLSVFKKVFENLIQRKIPVFIITRDPREHDEAMAIQSELGIRWFENMGIQVLLENGGHHRKLAIIDRKILYEGSLNILSQTKSREIMRRIKSYRIILQMINFLEYPKYFNRLQF